MTPRNVALYLRVSTEDQTCANQMPDLTGYAERHGWKIAEQYVDEITGSKESRPALNRLREDAKTKKFTVVLCWKFDRISRNTRHLLTLHEELAKFNVCLVSVTEGIDTTTSAGKFTMTVMGAVAELERATLIERTKACAWRIVILQSHRTCHNVTRHRCMLFISKAALILAKHNTFIP